MGRIKIENLYKNYGQTEVLKGISAEFDSSVQGHALLGSSGSGKSTLLHILGGLDRADSGLVEVSGKAVSSYNDEELAKYRREVVGLVFQFHYLMEAMTGEENILLPAKISGKSLKAERPWALYLAEKLGVTHCLGKYPGQMSGGEQQRIGIVRALGPRPPFLLCDEPTGNLDEENSEKVASLLIDATKEAQSCLLVVTHDAHLASLLAMQWELSHGRIMPK